MKNIPFIIIAAGVITVAAGCRTNDDGFSATELQTINADGAIGIMRLCTVDNETDSLLLRTVSRPVTEKIFHSDEYGILAERMLATVRNPENEGVGIAAPQVGVLRRMIAVQRFDKEGEPFEIYVNPEITRYSETRQTGTEGCLSIPDIYGEVSRAADITLRYRDGKTFEEKCEEINGFTAVIFQHEVDHLDGKLFTDIMIPPAE